MAAKAAYLYDDQGRVYRAIQCGDPSADTCSQALVMTDSYDGDGNIFEPDAAGHRPGVSKWCSSRRSRRARRSDGRGHLLISSSAPVVTRLWPQLTSQLSSVFDRVSTEIVVEIGPHAPRILIADTLCPHSQFRGGVVMAVPSTGAMKSDVDFIARLDQFIRQARRAARTENCVRLFEREIGLPVPPTSMAELDDVPLRRIQLIKNPLQTGRGCSGNWEGAERGSSPCAGGAVDR